MTTQNLKSLGEPLPSTSISWRVGFKNEDKTRGQALPYIDARVVQNRLDEVVGPGAWKNRFQEVVIGDRLVAVRCALSVKVDGEWVEKEDAAQLNGNDEKSDLAIKGVYSDALKRAAVQWGIGRYLYAFNAPWVDLDERGYLMQVPGLPQELLPEGEVAKAVATPAPKAPAAVQAAKPAPEPATKKVSADESANKAVLAPATSVDDSRKDSSDALVDKNVKAVAATQVATPTEATAPMTPASPAVEVAPSTANQSGEPTLPADATDEQRSLVADLETKMLKLPPAMIRSYVNGPKGQEKLSAGCREYLLSILARREGAVETA